MSLTFAAGLPGTGTAGLLGVIGYGQDAANAPPGDIPWAAPDMPPLAGGTLLELWTTDEPVRRARVEGAVLSATEGLLFGVLEADEAHGVPLEELSRDLYARLFGLIAREGYPHLYRIWNYFPRITALADGLERYRRFCLGRHEAFAAQGRPVDAAPAACALGSGSGPLTVLFLAGKAPGQPLENPRQVSAYRYPPRYGPRSPTFSRGLLARLGGRGQLLISGTASIIGHESRHPGDPAAQTEEAMANIRAIIAEARAAGLAGAGRLLLKSYVRHPEMLGMIRPVVEAQLGPQDRAVFLKADICRPELLVEIEGALI